MGVYFLNLKQNREIWIKRVEEFNSSNLSQTAWCKENGIKPSSLRYWLGKINNKRAVKSDDSSIELASISIIKNSDSKPIALEIKDVKLSLTNNYDEMLLLKLLKTLRKL